MQTSTIVALAVGLCAPAAAVAAPPAEAPVPTSQSLAHNDAEVLAVAQRLEGAAQQWDTSCRKPNALGLCVTVAHEPAGPNQCADALLGQVTVHPRQRKRAKRALKAIDKALKEASILTAPVDEVAATRWRAALARAQLIAVDHQLETLMTITAPADLYVVTEEWKKDSGLPQWEKDYATQRAKQKKSEAAFREFISSKSALLAQVHKDYAALSPTLGPNTTVASSLRAAWAQLHTGDALRAITVPKDLRDKPQMRAVLCDALLDQAEVFTNTAKTAVEFCIEHSGRHGLTGPSVTECKALYQRLPKPAPPTTP